jgi:hypothetical protein
LEYEVSNESAIIQSAIRTSGALKQKIKDYFDKLEMTMKNTEEIWLIISSISKIETLNYIDEYEYLEKSLLNAYSADYFIKWSQCFLTKKQQKIISNLEQLFEKYLYRFHFTYLKGN